jgi:hypothetical protein
MTPEQEQIVGEIIVDMAAPFDSEGRRLFLSAVLLRCLASRPGERAVLTDKWPSPEWSAADELACRGLVFHHLARLGPGSRSDRWVVQLSAEGKAMAARLGWIPESPDLADKRAKSE